MGEAHSRLAPLFRGNALIGRLLVIAVGLPLLWLSVGVTANFAGERIFPPATLLRLWPWGSRAMALDALAGLETARSRADVAHIEREGQAALEREPVNVLAVRAIGLSRLSFGDETGMARAFSYAERLSRRDAPTELMNIERAVQRNDIAAALRHYDHVLRTAPDVGATLLPVLVHAASDPGVGPALRRMVAQRPPWALDLGRVAAEESDDGSALFALAVALRLDTGAPNEARLAGAVMRRLIALRAYPLAARYYGMFVSGGATETLHGGDFERSLLFAPLDWQLREESDPGATIEPRADGGHALRLYAHTSSGGTVATQMLFLRPGAYVLSGEAGDTAPDVNDRPLLALRCRGGNSFATVVLPHAAPETSARFRETVTVPGECMPQEIVIRTAPGTDTDAWVDNLALTPASGRASGAAR